MVTWLKKRIKVDQDCEQSVFARNSVGKKATKNATQVRDHEQTSVACEAASLSYVRTLASIPHGFLSQRETAHSLTSAFCYKKFNIVFESSSFSRWIPLILMSTKRWPRCRFVNFMWKWRYEGSYILTAQIALILNFFSSVNRRKRSEKLCRQLRQLRKSKGGKKRWQALLGKEH